jgi:hypothetical protein
VEYGDESFFAMDDHGTGHDAGHDDLTGDAGIGGGLGGGYEDHGAHDEPPPPEHPATHTEHPARPSHPAHPSHPTHPAPHPDDRGHGGPGHDPHVPAGHLYVDYEGHHYDAGEIDVDRDHDGHVDTAVIHSPGQNEYYTDRDGDGQADELTIFAPDGHLISHETMGADGHWHETPYGDQQHHEPTAAANDGHIAVNYNGTRYDAGTATVDSDGDGRPDTAIIHSPGQIEYYIDRDGDGKADELTITNPHGQLISHEELNPKTGRWQETPLHGPLPRPH